MNKPQEDSYDEECYYHPCRTKGHRSDGPTRAWPEKNFWDVLAFRFGRVWYGSLGTRQALSLVFSITDLRGKRRTMDRKIPQIKKVR